MKKHTQLIATAFLITMGAVHCGKASVNGAAVGSGNQPPTQPPPVQPATPGLPTTTPCAPGTAEEIDFTQPAAGAVTLLPVDPAQVARVISVTVDGRPVAFTYDSISGTVGLAAADAGSGGSAIAIDACSPTPVGTGPGGPCGGKPCGKPSPKPSPCST